MFQAKNLECCTEQRNGVTVTVITRRKSDREEREELRRELDKLKERLRDDRAL